MANSATEWLVETAKKHTPSQGRGFGRRLVAESRRQKKFEPRHSGDRGLNLKQLAVACFGPAWESRLKRVSAGREWVGEASGEVIDLTVFKDITGAVAVEQVEAGYQQAASVANQLVGTWTSDDNPLDEATIPETASSPDVPENLPPATDYPRMGVEPSWVKAPRPQKFGLIGALPLEWIKAGRSTDYLDLLAECGRAVGTDEAERKLRVVVGITNNYNRMGTTTNTYLTSGAYVNKLTDFDITNGPKELDRFLQLAAQMVHPTTGKNVVFTPTGILTVPANMFQVRHVSNLSEYRQGDGADVTAISQGNPLGMNFPALTDPQLRRILIAESGLTSTQVDTITILADFQAAFKWREIEPFSTFEVDDTDESWPPHFFADVVHAVKARSWGVAFVRESRKAYYGFKA